MPSVQHSVKGLFAESLTLSSAALGKAFFVECPTKGTRQRIQHSAKPQIPVVFSVKACSLYLNPYRFLLFIKYVFSLSMDCSS
jgi:hypothetical protein